ncbi:MAG: VWA-like domain-containing protein [Gammaproteobacteria bacterium]|nr:VWA-like domain-containing protein [Gammaproteobacteria bacterium]MDH5778502.1 VWA-like domain-containing protein [Gammaproteobacteria bacterium]
MSIKQDNETKIAAARTRLIIDKPFLGALVLRLPVIEANPEWCKTTATDARNFYYNPEYIEQLSLSETEFILAHEALHCALSHFARREHRVKHRWDVACDFAINPILIKEGLQQPPGTLSEKSYEGMTAEEIYPYIDENDDQETLDQHIYDENESSSKNQQNKPPPQKPDSSGESNQDQNGEQPPPQGGSKAEQDENQEGGKNGVSQPPPLGHEERESLNIQWQQRLAGAAQQAMQAGKMDGDMARLVDFLLQPRLPWRMLLARYMSGIARDDYSYTRPSNRRGDPAIFPSLRSSQAELVVAVDTSGSINHDELNDFVSEIDAIKGQIRARITFIACDSKFAADCPWVYEPWEEFSLPESISGGGGTDFTPVFNWADTQDRAPDLLVYFTDAEGKFPDAMPNYPVLWLVKGKHPTPWGQRIQLN